MTDLFEPPKFSGRLWATARRRDGAWVLNFLELAPSAEPPLAACNITPALQPDDRVPEDKAGIHIGAQGKVARVDEAEFGKSPGVYMTWEEVCTEYWWDAVGAKWE